LRHLRIRPAFAKGLPTAIVGALAAALTGPAAVAAEPEVRIEKRESAIRLAATSVPATYVVKKGDTVSAIAARYGLRTADVLARNGLTWSSVIRPGQVLTLRGPAKAAAPHKAAPSASYRVYAVKRGDTVSAIAQRAGVSVQRILSANKLTWSSIIYPGQRLRIPDTTTSVPAAKAPAAKKAPAAVKSAAKPAAKGTHTVRGGDTAWAIATRYGVSVDALLRANGLSRSAIIYPGQKLAVPGAAAASGAAKAPAKSSAKTVSLNAEQRRNAKLIIRVGRQLGVPERGIAIALGTAMQESSLRNLTWGDRDSRGLFQQRPSTGWGTVAQVQNAERSTRVFFGGPKDPNGSRTRGLLDIRGWQKMSFAQAAQAVQISAYPDRYARWEDDAYAWLRALG
jgi:LysM repeat protein